MVLTQDDMAGIAAMVAQTVQQLLAAQPPVQPQQPPVQPMPDHQRRSTLPQASYIWRRTLERLVIPIQIINESIKRKIT